MLDGLKVLTVDNYFAGNYGPLLLALHGADVVKVERPGGGDVLRRDPPFVAGADPPVGHGELRLLRAKSSIALDLESQEGRCVFDKLVGEADVFWTNLRPVSLKRSQLTYDDLKQLNPGLIYAALSGFGLEDPGPEDSPFSGTLAFDAVIQGAAGLMMRNSDADGTPQYNGIAIADQVTSLYAAFGILLALQRRQRTGEGAFIDVSMFDSMIALNEKSVTLNGMGFPTPPRASATNAPFGAYRASDGWIIIGVGGPTLWKRFCEAMGRPELFARPDLETGIIRVKNEAAILRPLIEEWLSELTADEAVAILGEHHVPVGLVLDVGDPRLMKEARRRGVVADTDLGPAGSFPSVQSPILIDGHSYGCGKPAVGLGGSGQNILQRWLGECTSESPSPSMSV